MSMIITSECESCVYGNVDDSDKAKVMIYCKAKDKTYYYGQYIPCEIKKKKYKKEVQNGS